MTKYYRVRTQEQWDWLMNKFEKQGIKWQNGEAPTWLVENYDFVFGEKGAVVSFDGDCLRMGGHGNKLIEVSDLMKEKKMEDYVTIDSGDFDKIKFDRPQEDGNSFVVKKVNVMGYDTGKYVRDVELPTDLLIPKSLLYPKVRMSVVEKKEFDELKNEMSAHIYDLDDLLTRTKDSEDYPLLYHRLYVADGDGVESQLEFACAWADESLIEIIPDKKWNVKVPISCNDAYYNKVLNDCKDAVMVKHDVDKRSLQINNNFKFTAEELKYYGLDNDLFEKVEVSE